MIKSRFQRLRFSSSCLPLALLEIERGVHSATPTRQIYHKILSVQWSPLSYSQVIYQVRWHSIQDIKHHLNNLPPFITRMTPFMNLLQGVAPVCFIDRTVARPLTSRTIIYTQRQPITTLTAGKQSSQGRLMLIHMLKMSSLKPDQTRDVNNMAMITEVIITDENHIGDI